MPFDSKPARAKRVLPSGKADDPIRVVAISGVSDPDTLMDIAQGIYEETARQELEGTFETDDPSSYGVDFAAADLLDLHAGQPIKIETDARRQGEVGDSITLLQGMTIPERVLRLKDAGFRPKVALAYAVLLDSANLQTVFCVSNVDIDFDKDEGLSIGVGFQNYVTIREDMVKTISADVSPTAAARTKGQKGATAKRLRDQSQARKLAEKTGQDTNVPTGVGSVAAYEQLQREGANADYADEILAEPQTKF